MNNTIKHLDNGDFVVIPIKHPKEILSEKNKILKKKYLRS